MYHDAGSPVDVVARGHTYNCFFPVIASKFC
uniref:Uncharacterized protein n=1 Tax=Arundo donax TaxID=35708 RepID=A0A0A9EAV9_ARUDO